MRVASDTLTLKTHVAPRFLLALSLGAVSPFARAEEIALEEVASFPNQQVTGVTVSKTGRVFVNFPF